LNFNDYSNFCWAKETMSYNHRIRNANEVFTRALLVADAARRNLVAIMTDVSTKNTVEGNSSVIDTSLGKITAGLDNMVVKAEHKAFKAIKDDSGDDDSEDDLKDDDLRGDDLKGEAYAAWKKMTLDGVVLCECVGDECHSYAKHRDGYEPPHADCCQCTECREDDWKYTQDSLLCYGCKVKKCPPYLYRFNHHL
jgi:hypothetical protein